MQRARLVVAFVLGCAMAAAVGQDQKQKALEEAREAELRAIKTGDRAAIKAAQEKTIRLEEEARKSAGTPRSKSDGMPDDCDPRRVICDVFPPKPAPGTPKPPPEGPILFKQAREMEKAGDTKDAVRLYRRAARQGSGPAAKRLGDIHSCGVPGIAPDRADALAWYDVARKLKMKGVPPTGQLKKC